MTTNVICTDGTVIECEQFEAVDSGVLLYFAADDVAEEEDEREAELTASGFVPIQAIRYVLPADIEVRPTGAGQPAGTPTSGQQPPQTGGAAGPPQGGTPPAAGPAPTGYTRPEGQAGPERYGGPDPGQQTPPAGGPERRDRPLGQR